MKTSIKKMKLADLIPTENNPRQIKKDDFERLKKPVQSFPQMLDIREIDCMSNRIKDELAFIKVIRRFVKQNIWYLTAKDYQRGVVYDVRISERKMKEEE